jgi:hypothetical protein
MISHKRIMESNLPLQHKDSAPDYMADYTRKGVETMLKAKKIERNSESWSEYEQAKKIIFRGQFINPDDAARVTTWIMDYVNV